MRTSPESDDRTRLAPVGEVDLCYDTFGNPDHPGMLLVMGLGFQLVHWREEFCRLLAAEGFFVVRFDNRDSGRSTHLPGRRYTLDDMADDAVGLLDALGIDSAHVVGASLGGMITQTMAIRHPARVRSLASLMSTTGRRGAGRTSLRVLRHAVGRRPRNEQEAIERRVRVFRAIGSTGFEQDTEEIRRVTASPSAAIPTPGTDGAVSTARCGPPATGPRACGWSPGPRSSSTGPRTGCAIPRADGPRPRRSLVRGWS